MAVGFWLLAIGLFLLDLIVHFEAKSEVPTSM